MPLYEYLCNSCGHRFEKIVKFSDEPLRVCPKCGKESVEQLISAPAVQFKGEGWYVTDYARKGSVSGGSDKKVEASAGDSKSDSKSESKSDSKSESAPKSDSTSTTKSESTTKSADSQKS